MYKHRINLVRKKLTQLRLQGILISNFFNILYLSGFKTLTPEEREAYLFITKNTTYIFTDGRYIDKKLEDIISSLDAKFRLIEVGKSLYFHLEEIILEEGLESIGIEEDDLKLNEYQKLKQLKIEIVPVSDVCTSLRSIKTSDEIEAITTACRETDNCLKEIIPLIKNGMSEKELAWKIEVWIREKGFELGFDPIVAVNENSAIPHYDTKTGDGLITESSVLLLDFGIEYKSYVSDITRMVFIGKQSDEVMNTYNYLLNAQAKTIEFIKKGKMLNEVDAFCREELKKSGLPNFAHSTGHGVGLEVHESPRVSMKSLDEVNVHQVFTVEPGVYHLNRFGMRIEDTILVNEKFQAVPLTKFPKELLLFS